MSNAVLIKDLLDEYRSRLGLDGSSKVLVLDEDVHKVVEQWCNDNHMSYAPSITVSETFASAGHWPHQEDSFTHTFAEMKDTSKAMLQNLKWIQWSLRYKGIAILTLSNQFAAEHADIVDFVEDASFERGRIRVLDRQMQSEDNTCTSTTKVVIAMKWDMLSA